MFGGLGVWGFGWCNDVKQNQTNQYCIKHQTSWKPGTITNNYSPPNNGFQITIVVAGGWATHCLRPVCSVHVSFHCIPLTLNCDLHFPAKNTSQREPNLYVIFTTVCQNAFTFISFFYIGTFGCFCPHLPFWNSERTSTTAKSIIRSSNMFIFHKNQRHTANKILKFQHGKTARFWVPC